MTSGERIIEASKTLFWERGIQKVTVEEISDLAEVSKMTFYRHFSGKLEVAQLILEEFAREGMEQFDRILDLEVGFAEKVHLMLQYKYERAQGVSKELITDLYTNQPELMTHLQKVSKHSQDRFTEALKDAQKKGEIRKDMSIEFMLFMLNKFQEKTLDQAFMDMFDTATDATRALSEFFFYGIFPHD